MQYTNTAKGMRGINLEDGTTVWIDAGKTADLDKAKVSHVHDDIVEGAKAAKEATKDTETPAA